MRCRAAMSMVWLPVASVYLDRPNNSRCCIAFLRSAGLKCSTAVFTRMLLIGLKFLGLGLGLAICQPKREILQCNHKRPTFKE